jgi:hypothetical protein
VAAASATDVGAGGSAVVSAGGASPAPGSGEVAAAGAAGASVPGAPSGASGAIGDAGDVPRAGSPSLIPIGSNQPPRITGAPPTLARAGVDYEFAPVASDPEGGALSFSATNLPAWVTFDASSGRLGGQPRSSDGGLSEPILLTVSDGVSQASLAEFRIEVQPGQGKGLVKLAWQLPDRNADGSTIARALGTRIYYGRVARNYEAAVTVPGRGATRHVLTGLDSGTWYIAMTSVDPEGLESDFSDERVAIVN